MTTYDQWKTDPDPHGVDAAAIEAQERAHDEEIDHVKRLELKSAALGWFADFVRRLDNANRSELPGLARRIGRMPDLLLTHDADPDEIKF
jgi:hypothetical protein